MDLRKANLEFHIEELVLHGFEGNDRSLISAAVQQELTRLFTERGVPRSFSQGGTINQINGGSFEMATGTRADVIGTQIAQSIYGGLGE
jgi:hypothetical protein